MPTSRDRAAFLWIGAANCAFYCHFHGVDDDIVVIGSARGQKAAIASAKLASPWPSSNAAECSAAFGVNTGTIPSKRWWRLFHLTG